jgi:hypothetical protein
MFCGDVGVTCRMVEWVADGHYCRKFCLISECLASYVSGVNHVTVTGHVRARSSQKRRFTSSFTCPILQ